MDKVGLKETIKELMKASQISKIAELARQVDVPQQTLHRIASGATTNPQVATLQAIADYFEVTVSQLIGEEPLLLDDKNNQLTINKIPRLRWEDAPYWERLTNAYVPENWQYWAVTKTPLNKGSYTLSIESHTLPMPFTHESVLIIDPTKNAKDGDFVICHRKSDHTISIKKIETDGGDTYLFPIKNISQPVRLDENYQLCGVVVKIDVNLAKE